MTFDLSAALQGRAYPSTQVKVYLDEETAYLIYTEKKRIGQLTGEDLESAQAGLDALIDKMDSQAYTFHLKGRSRLVLREIAKKALAQHPTPKNVLAIDEASPDRQDYHDALMWEACTEKIVAPTGEELVEPGLEQIIEFRNHAPKYALNAISEAVNELIDQGVTFDFEKQSVDFS